MNTYAHISMYTFSVLSACFTVLNNDICATKQDILDIYQEERREDEVSYFISYISRKRKVERKLIQKTQGSKNNYEHIFAYLYKFKMIMQ